MPLLLPFRKMLACRLFFSGALILYQTVCSQTITTVAGNGRNAAVSNGSLASSSSVPYPIGVAVDGGGNLYITSAERVWKVEAATGTMSLFAGTGRFGHSGDGGKATDASLQSPVAVCFDKAGNLFIAEYNGQRIRKVSPEGSITTIAGTGTPGFEGDGGLATAAKLNSPRSVAVDPAGNLYIADLHNHRIRKITASTGIITTVAGNGKPSFTGDGGPSGNAGIAAPTALFFDETGNLFFSEADVSLSCRVRKIAAGSGIITTVAGNGAAGYSGDGGSALQARLFVPTGITGDKSGNLFIAQYNDSRIRMVEVGTGLISTIAGNGSHSFCCDGGLATDAALNNPMGLAMDTAGNLFVADNNNHRIRKIETKVVCVPPRLSLTASSTLYCYNTAAQFTTTLSGPINNPVYQWKLNGEKIGGNVEAATLPAAVGDVVTCEVTGTACGNRMTLVSNPVTIQSNPGYNRGPEVSIVADKEEFCSGMRVLLKATNVSESAHPAYQWLVNGRPAGSNSDSFSTTTLADGDKVECIMSVPHCGSNGGTTKDYSNSIAVKVHPVPQVRFEPASVIIEPGEAVQLKPLVSGTIIAHQWSPALWLTDPASLLPLTKRLDGNTTFRLWVQTADGCEDSASFTITAYSRLYMPSAFTPNGDGKNDIFRIPPAAPFTLNEFKIFDRWGSMVFSTSDISKGWDGKIKSTGVIPGTYVYIVRGQDHKGPVFLKGSVQLLY